jgi:hypothetical protein
LGADITEKFPDYEVLNDLIEAAKRNQQAIQNATEALSDAIKTLNSKAPFPHYEVLNGLIEAAKHNQSAVESATQAFFTAIATLRKQTSDLPNALVDPVADTLLPKLIGELSGVIRNGEVSTAAFQRSAERATATFEEIAQMSVWKFYLVPTLCFLVLGVVMIFLR